MARFDRFSPGQFSWVDLLSPDAEASSRFYTRLFGWSPQASRDDQGAPYTLFQQQGLDVAGMAAMGEQMREAGVPSAWSSYVTVEDADVATVRARALGAEVQLPVLDIEVGARLSGRMAMLADPEGARFSVWQPGDHKGFRIANEPGSCAWNELCARDVDGARSFYGELFGWSFHEPEGGDGYQEIRLGERANGGILPWREEMGPVPPAWTAYFAVADCDESVKRVQELGGRLLAGPTDIAAGRFAVVADPLGAVFHVMFLHAPDD